MAVEVNALASAQFFPSPAPASIVAAQCGGLGFRRGPTKRDAAEGVYCDACSRLTVLQRDVFLLLPGLGIEGAGCVTGRIRGSTSFGVGSGGQG